MLSEPHPVIDFWSLVVILLAAVNYGVAAIWGTDFIAKIDPIPPTSGVAVGACGVWQMLRQQYF